MLVLIATFYAHVGRGDEVAAALARMAPLVKAQEPNCLQWQPCRSQDNPDVLLIFEQYTDQAALDHHREMPYFKEIVQGTVMPMVERRERAFYDLVR